MEGASVLAGAQRLRGVAAIGRCPPYNDRSQSPESLPWPSVSPLSPTPACSASSRRRPGALGLRFGVERTGCSGWGHVTDLAREARPDDAVFEQDGVRIYVDATSLPLVDGTEIDFAKQGLGETFVFRNPNATAECGCGESFTTDATHAAAP